MEGLCVPDLAYIKRKTDTFRKNTNAFSPILYTLANKHAHLLNAATLHEPTHIPEPKMHIHVNVPYRQIQRTHA